MFISGLLGLFGFIAFLVALRLLISLGYGLSEQESLHLQQYKVWTPSDK